MSWRIPVALALALSACAGAQKPAPAPEPEPARPAPPAGPTKTDFETIAKKLLARCVRGGWISEWRSKQPNVEIARPKIRLVGFDDQTGQGLDPQYLNSVLERRMRTSGVYDMVTDDPHFDARGKLLRLAERSGDGRVSVYTAVLEILEPGTSKIAYSCEASVSGEL